MKDFNSEDDLPILKGLLKYGTAPEYMTSVRFGRVPKREKARIIAAMHNVQNRTFEKAIMKNLDDENTTIKLVFEAYASTCDYTREKVRRLKSLACDREPRQYIPGQSSCPIFPSLDTFSPENIDLYRSRFSDAIHKVLDFACKLPTFQSIPEDDRMLLLKTGVFEGLLLSFSRFYEPETGNFLCIDGYLMQRGATYSQTSSRFLMDSMCEYAERMNVLDLSDEEMALFTAIVIITPNRPGLKNARIVRAIHNKLSEYLENYLQRNRPCEPDLYRNLLNFIPDIKTLNQLHSDKYFCDKEMRINKAASVNETVNNNGSWEDPRISWEEKESCISSPTSSCSDEVFRSPELVNVDYSGSPDGSICGNEISTIMEFHPPMYSSQNKSPSEGSLSGDECSSDVGLMKCPFNKRKMDSPSDSGFESDKLSSSSSSSPESSIDEKIEEDREEDMPVLRRALQAPPIMNTDLMMEEAYKPHKKFRALRREEEPHSSSSSILAQTLSLPHSSSLLANALSAPSLAKSLSETPKMSEDVLREADRIHSLMITNESIFQRSKKHHRVAPAPSYNSHSVKERLEPPPTWRNETSASSSSSSSSSTASHPRFHLLTTPSPSRYRGTRIGLGCRSMSNMNGRSSSSSVMSLQMDMSDSQPLNLSKKTPPPTSFMVEA